MQGGPLLSAGNANAKSMLPHNLTSTESFVSMQPQGPMLQHNRQQPLLPPSAISGGGGGAQNMNGGGNNMMNGNNNGFDPHQSLIPPVMGMSGQPGTGQQGTSSHNSGPAGGAGGLTAGLTPTPVGGVMPMNPYMGSGGQGNQQTLPSFPHQQQQPGQQSSLPGVNGMTGSGGLPPLPSTQQPPPMMMPLVDGMNGASGNNNSGDVNNNNNAGLVPQQQWMPTNNMGMNQMNPQMRQQFQQQQAQQQQKYPQQQQQQYLPGQQMPYPPMNNRGPAPGNYPPNAPQGYLSQSALEYHQMQYNQQPHMQNMHGSMYMGSNMMNNLCQPSQQQMGIVPNYMMPQPGDNNYANSFNRGPGGPNTGMGGGPPGSNMPPMMNNGGGGGPNNQMMGQPNMQHMQGGGGSMQQGAPMNGHFMQQNPNMGGMNPGGQAPQSGGGGTQHTEEHRKQVLKQQQQRLLLLRHASKCPHENGRCPVTPHCWSMKQLWKHIMSCKDQECKTPHCVSSRYVLSHYSKCKEPTCPVCGPVREAIKRNYERSRDIVKTTRGNGANGYGMPGMGMPMHNAPRGDEPPAKRQKKDRNSAKDMTMGQKIDERHQQQTLIISRTQRPLRCTYPLDPISCAMYSFSPDQIQAHFCSIHEGMKLTVAKIKEMCKPMLDEMYKVPHVHSIFGYPVDPVALGLPDYYEVVKIPMDLGTISKKLTEGSYRDLHNFVVDVHLTFDNAMNYNPKNSDVYICWRRI